MFLCEREQKKRERVNVFNEGLLLLVFNNNEHRLEQFVGLLSLDLPTTVGRGRKRAPVQAQPEQHGAQSCLCH